MPEIFVTRLFVQYTISLSSLCKIIWRHWTYKMSVRYTLSSVWVRLSIFSQLSIIQSIIQYVGLCVFSLPTPLVMIEIIYILCLIIIIIKSEVWSITHCLGLGHETMVCAVCLSIFLRLRWWPDVVYCCYDWWLQLSIHVCNYHFKLYKTIFHEIYHTITLKWWWPTLYLVHASFGLPIVQKVIHWNYRCCDEWI